MRVPSRSLEGEGKRNGEGTRASIIYFFGSQGEGRGSPWRERARTFCDPFCPHPHWAFSLLTSPGQYLVARDWGSAEREDSFPNAPDLLLILWDTSTALLSETGRKIILLICCFIYLHSVMIYFDVSF